MPPPGDRADSHSRANSTAQDGKGRQVPSFETDGESVPETAVVVISSGGADVACLLAARLSGALSIHVAEKYLAQLSSQSGCVVESFPLPLRPVISQLFGRYRRLVLIMPLGAAVRLIAPLLEHKHEDPAVVCVDDTGRFAVSLLSGHLGGADALAKEVADALGATPVITSASHVKNTLAVDLLGREFGWQLQANSNTVTRVSAAVVNGEPVAVLQEAGERDWQSDDTAELPNLMFCASPRDLISADCQGALVISDREDPFAEVTNAGGFKVQIVLYRPRSLVVGMGCRRGVHREHLEELMAGAFQRHNLSLESIKCIATAEIKKDEPGLLELATRYGVPVVCYGAGELNSVFDVNIEASPSETIEVRSPAAETLTRSQVAHRLLGVWGVSEPSALLASGASQLLVSREKTDRATVAVARIPFH